MKVPENEGDGSVILLRDMEGVLHNVAAKTKASRNDLDGGGDEPDRGVHRHRFDARENASDLEMDRQGNPWNEMLRKRSQDAQTPAFGICADDRAGMGAANDDVERACFSRFDNTPAEMRSE